MHTKMLATTWLRSVAAEMKYPSWWVLQPTEWGGVVPLSVASQPRAGSSCAGAACISNCIYRRATASMLYDTQPLSGGLLGCLCAWWLEAYSGRQHGAVPVSHVQSCCKQPPIKKKVPNSNYPQTRAAIGKSIGAATGAAMSTLKEYRG